MLQSPRTNDVETDQIPTFAAISRQYLRPTRDWGASAGDKVALCSRRKKRLRRTTGLLIDGPRDFYLAHRSGQKPAERTFSRIFFALIFFFLVYAFLTPPPPPGPSAFASASSSPSSSFSSASSRLRSLDEGEISRRPREAHVKERKKS